MPVPRFRSLALATAVVLAACTSTPSGAASTSPPPSIPASGPGPTSQARIPAPVVRRVPLPADDLQAPFPEQLAVAGGAIWIEHASRPVRLIRVDASSGQVTATVDLDAVVRLFTGDDGSLWTVGPYGYAPGPPSMTLSRVDLTTAAIHAVAQTPGHWVAVGLGSIWVSSDGRLDRLDEATGRLQSRRSIDLGEPQVACGAVWGLSGVGGVDATLKRLNPDTGTVERYGVESLLLERPDGCWGWTASGLARVWPRPPVVVANASRQFVWFEGSNAWLRPYGAIQRWDPATGRGIGTTWLVDPADINPIAKIGDDGRVVTAGGHVWLITATNAVEYDIPSA